ncbi:MAG: MerR family transcriptional regulator [Oscillospiraceae bacterium]|nr:MerR family transcriptional regulator [Oscillospiraceae bacterium]
MSNYTTGEMAKLCNVSVRTVQFYDTKGILHPSDLTEGGRRIYNDDDLRKFQLICTLKAIGLSLNSIKSVLESELSGKILTLLLDERVKMLADEIDERQKQLEMINVIKESIRDKAIIPANTILGIEGIMERKRKVGNKKKLHKIQIVIWGASALGFAFMVWLAALRIWWGLAVYVSVSIISLLISAFHLKDYVFICPNCDSIFKPSLRRAFFSVGNAKVRWMTCPECRNEDWCVLRKQKQIRGAENNG